MTVHTVLGYPDATSRCRQTQYERIENVAASSLQAVGDRHDRECTVSRHVKQLEALGYVVIVQPAA